MFLKELVEDVFVFVFLLCSQQSMMVACAAFWDDNAGDRVANKSIDICVAVATDKVNIINASPCQPLVHIPACISGLLDCAGTNLSKGCRV